MPTWFYEVAALLAVLLMLPSHLIYGWKIRTGECKPSPLTWGVLAWVSAWAAVIQFAEGAGWGTVPMAFAAAANAVIALVSWRLGYLRAATTWDRRSGGLAVAAWAAWLVADVWLDHVWADELATAALAAAGLLAFWPTVRKTWDAPFDEPPSKYALSTLRYVFATLAVQEVMFSTAFIPALWIGVNGLFLAYLVGRRRSLTAPALQAT